MRKWIIIRSAGAGDNYTYFPSSAEVGHTYSYAQEEARRVTAAFAQRDEARAEVARLTAWILEADSAFAVNGAKSTSLDDCLGLVRMCHEGRAAIDEVARLREALTEALDPNTEWTSSTWERLLAIRDGSE